MKILLLGSGELGKNLQSLHNASANCNRCGQLRKCSSNKFHDFEVINMLDGDALDKIVAKHQPDFIVPEIEAIRTERFMITRSKESLVPSAKAANFTE
jgi:phosphoribosylglycinamide formyltransferase 2